MEKFEDANNRLRIAVDKLEVLLTDSDNSMAAKVTSLSRKLEITEEERDSLLADLGDVRSANDKLHVVLRQTQEKTAAMEVVNEAVAGRIDLAIESLQKIVGGK